MEIKGDLNIKKDLILENLPSQSVLGTDGTGKVIAGSGGGASTEIVALIPTQINVSSAGDTYTDVAGNTYAETANQTRLTLTAARTRAACWCCSGHVSAGTGSFELYNFTDSTSLGVATTTATSEANVAIAATSAVSTNNGDDLTLRVKNSTAGATVTIDNGGIGDCDSAQTYQIAQLNTTPVINIAPGYPVDMSFGLLKALSTNTIALQLGYFGNTSDNFIALNIGNIYGTAEANTVFARTGTLKLFGYYYNLANRISAINGSHRLLTSFQLKADNI